MKKILFLAVALIMSVCSMWADIAPGYYTIKVYSTGKYLAPTSDFSTSGASKVVYSDDAATWEISAGGTASTNCIGQRGTNRCLNPWNYSSNNTAPVGSWGSGDGGVSHGGDNEWLVVQVEGDIYTIKSYKNSCYLWYNSSSDNLYFTPTNEGDACKFVFEAIPVDYTVTVTGAPSDVTVSFKGEAVVGNTFSARGEVTASDITATVIPGYKYTVTVSGTTVTVTYSVKSFPEAGTYYVTFTGKATDGRNNCLYNDLTQADGYTLQAASQPSSVADHNNFIWKAECDGTYMTIVNGQGSTMKLKNNSGDRTFNKINYVAHNSNYYLKPVLSSGTLSSNGHDCLNVSNGSYKNAANTPCLTSWSTTSGPNAGDNHWAVGVVDVTGLNEYTVTVTGADGYVNYGDQKAANGGFFLASSIVEGDLTASEVTGYVGSISLENKTITVSYTPAAVAYNVKVLGAALGVTIKGNSYVDGDQTDEWLDLTESDIVFAANDDYVGSVAINGTNIVVTYRHKGAAIDFAGKKVEVGEKATTIVPDTKWYVLTQLRGNETPTWVNSSNAVMRANEAAADLFPGKAEELASYLVRFVSTNVEGVYEIQHGNGMYWSTEGANNRKLAASSNAADSKFYFVYGATQSTSGADANGWAMNYTTDFTTKADKVDNDGKNSTVGYWGSGNTTSGTNNVWYIYETTFSDLPAYDWEAFQTKLNKLKQYTFGEGLGQYADVDLTEYYINSVEEALGLFADDFADKVENNYNEDIEIMDYILDNLHLNMPQDGQFLRMRGVVNTQKYLTSGISNGKYSMGTDAKESIFFYDGNHLLNYSTGLYTGVDGGTWAWAAVGAEGTQVTFHDASTAGAYRIQIPKGTGSSPCFFLYSGPANASNADRGGYNNVAACTDTRYQWYLEEVESLPVEFKAAGNGYATIYSPVALTIPEGVEAYTLTEGSEGYLHAEEVSGIIPAETGTVLFSEATGTTDFSVSAEAGTPTESALTGTYAAKTAGEGNYVFSIANEQAGFYKFAGATLAGFKAYYVPSTPSEVQAFVIDFGGQTVGIEGLQSVAPVKGAFDLQGRRVNAATHGLFIQNGKKVIK